MRHAPTGLARPRAAHHGFLHLVVRVGSKWRTDRHIGHHDLLVRNHMHKMEDIALPVEVLQCPLDSHIRVLRQQESSTDIRIINALADPLESTLLTSGCDMFVCFSTRQTSRWLHKHLHTYTHNEPNGSTAVLTCYRSALAAVGCLYQFVEADCTCRTRATHQEAGASSDIPASCRWQPPHSSLYRRWC